MKKSVVVVAVLIAFAAMASAQPDSSLFRRIPKDTVKQTMNMDAVYNRPFLGTGKMPISVGGYMEANWQHLGTDGISDGHQFQFRRMTLFFASTISRRIKFLSELEFEDGAKEISVEFAALDVEFHPLFNFRGGMIMNPIGAFNQNHDGPKWEFTDRPIPSTQMLPATWSNVGFGLYGKQYTSNWMVGYEIYLTGNFDNSIISNAENKTFLPAAKENPDRFEELNSGLPLFTGKVAVRNSNAGELGLSYMGGVFNKFMDDGLQVDKKRRIHVIAVDINSTVPRLHTNIVGEWAWIFADVPATYSQQYGDKQQGGFVDIVQPLLKQTIFGWDATINIACRLEYVDWNVGKFNETSGNIADDLWSIMPAISFRPNTQTVFRLNYRYQQQTDILGNPPAATGGFNLGLSSYF